MNGKWSLNCITPALLIEDKDLVYQQGDKKKLSNVTFHLGYFLMLPEDQILDQSRDKIIVIGDFDVRDKHESIFGDMAGSLVILNTYLSLVRGANILSGAFLTFLFFGYFVISLLIFLSADLADMRFIGKFAKEKMGNLMLNVMENFGLLLIISIISFYVFHKPINILLLGIWLIVVEYLTRRLPPH
ncbi:MAG: hypothetical protein B6244_00395 [Candidatus Cloacimonetes bacterium 4572_55]|nr:MAG: hypothetical protein B6244_00395 [Candidatus Cloacimonetes bacterium 4572_55]